MPAEMMGWFGEFLKYSGKQERLLLEHGGAVEDQTLESGGLMELGFICAFVLASSAFVSLHHPRPVSSHPGLAGRDLI